MKNGYKFSAQRGVLALSRFSSGIAQLGGFSHGSQVVTFLFIPIVAIDAV
jgi:hypothetical protein